MNPLTNAAVHETAENLFLIDLDLPRNGFHHFISSWLYRANGTTILVDPGPRSVFPTLRNALQFLGIRKIDAVLLTHIHIDHAGGAGLLLQDYPEIKFLCHPKGFNFLSQPERLWQESKKVLRDLADAYGEIEPVPSSALFYSDKTLIHDMEISAFETPGHAPHHLSFLIGDLLFAGEVAGIYYPLSQGFYLRPATPPIFRYEIFNASIQKAAKLPAGRICFGHYGSRTDAGPVFQKALNQLDFWLSEVKKCLPENAESFEDHVFNRLIYSDPLLEYYTQLPTDIQDREKFFSHNSIRGMRQYLLNL